MKAVRRLCLVLGAAVACGLVLIVTTPAGARANDVLLVINQSFDYRIPPDQRFLRLENFELPVLETAEDMVLEAGFDLADPDAGDEAAYTIEVWLEGRALGRTYFEVDGSYLYTGAAINGAVLLKESGGRSYYQEFQNVTPMPFALATVNLGYDKPQNAPFNDAFDRPNGFARALAEVMVSAWGVESVIPSVHVAEVPVRADIAGLLGDLGDTAVVPDLIDVLALDDSEAVRREAAWSLGRLGDRNAIDALIDGLQDPSDDVRWFSAWSLREITGQTFGKDHDAWSDWWAAEGDQIGG